MGQQVAPAAVVPAGGHAAVVGFSLGWTLGQCASASYTAPGRLLTAGVQQPEVLVAINVRALLDGPYVPLEQLMYDSLRARNLLPLQEPYASLGLPPAGLGTGPMPAALLQATGANAVVDWVYVELRPAADPTAVAVARAALVQRDGDVVDSDGVSTLRFGLFPGAYHVVVRHRNHLPVMTAAPIALGPQPVLVDFSDGSTTTFGTEAQRMSMGRYRLWAGNTVPDNAVRYTGPDNDRDAVLQDIGGLVPTAMATGYALTDVNLDGTIKYVGADNDRDVILQTIGGVIPTAVRLQQLP